MAVPWRWRQAWISLAVVGICLGFALKALGLIEATTLWSDELYSVGKSFQPSYGALLAMLREDTHPPLYYSLLWLWGQTVGQSPVTLRLLSWLAYGLGGLVMVCQTWALAMPRATTVPVRRALALAALLAFCSPYPVRFAVEGKSYALLVLLVAIAWFGRCLWLQAGCSPGLWLYAISVLAAALTHFYGLFLFGAAALWDGWLRRWSLLAAALLALLPALGWIVYARDYLFSSRSGSWIGRPDFALLEETLARALGPWPLPKLLVLLLVFLALRRWGMERSAPEQGLQPTLLDISGGSPSGLMVLGVVLISFVKPLAFSRYFVVLLPALVPWLSVRAASLPLTIWGRRASVLGLGLIMALWWHQSFVGITAAVAGSRESDQFRAISQETAAKPERYSPRPRLFNLSDRMEVAAGRIPPPLTPWGDADDLRARLVVSPLPASLWLAASGPDPVVRRRLKPLERLAEQAGYSCRLVRPEQPFSRLLLCRSVASDPSSPPPFVAP